MKGQIFSKIFKAKAVQKTVNFTVANAPKFLTGLSIISSLSATAFAIKGTIVAVEIERNRQQKIESGEIPVPEHPKLETFKAVGKCYIPALVFQVISIVSAIYGVDISTARTMMATTACKAAEYALEEYKAKNADIIGSDNERAIRQEIVKDHADQYVPQTTLVVSPYDQILFYEKLSGQVFRSDLNTVKDTFNKINYGLSHGYSDYISVMEYLDEFGISYSDEKRGWNVSMTGLLEPRFELDTTDNGQPCLKLSTTDPPYEEFNMYS